MIGMTHTDTEKPVRFIPARDYVARHRRPAPAGPSLRALVDPLAYASRELTQDECEALGLDSREQQWTVDHIRPKLVAIVARWLAAGDWRLIAGAVVSLVAAVILAVMTM